MSLDGVLGDVEGRIRGGGYTAARGAAFDLDADSNEELDELSTGLPHWGLVKIDVKPLISVNYVLERILAMRQRRRSLDEHLRVWVTVPTTLLSSAPTWRAGT